MDIRCAIGVDANVVIKPTRQPLNFPKAHSCDYDVRSPYIPPDYIKSTSVSFQIMGFHPSSLFIVNFDPSRWERSRIRVRSRHVCLSELDGNNFELVWGRNMRWRIEGCGCQRLKYILFDVPFPIFIFLLIPACNTS